MFKHACVVALAALFTAPTVALADDTANRQRYTLPVAQIDSDSFEVVEDDGAGNRQMWCAAGIYARKVLGQRGGDIYVETARGPSQSQPGRMAVVFTTAPVEEAFGTVTLGVRRAGATHTMTHAYALCHQFFQVRLRTGPNTLIRS